MGTGTNLERTQKTERRKLAKFAGAGAGTVGLFLLGWPMVGAAALLGTGYLAYDWFMYRAKNGMRF
jgi:hypothetical protein